MKKITYLYFIFFSTVISLSSSTNPIVHKTEKYDILLKLKAETSYPDSTKKLQSQIETLDVDYTLWGCSCPNWIRVSDLDKQEDTATSFINYHFYLEPEEVTLDIPDNFDPFLHKLIFKGQFYEEEGLPQGWIRGEDPIQLAKVFRCSKLKIMVLDKKRS